MKCQILFSGKNKKNIINLSSAENAQRVVKVKSNMTYYCVAINNQPRSEAVPQSKFRTS